MTVLTYAEELERKTLAFCEDAALRHQQGVYGDRDLGLVMNAVWQCTAGLVDGLNEIMDASRDAAPSPEPIRKIAIMKGRGPIVIERDGVRVCLRIGFELTPGNIVGFDTEADAVQSFNKLTKELTIKGYAFI